MFDIYTDGLRTAAMRFQDGSNGLIRNTYEIEDVKSLISGLSGMDFVISVLNGLQDDVRLEARQQEALYSTGTWIARRFDDCEDDILANMDNEKFEINVPNYRMIDFKRNMISQNTNINHVVLNEILELFR